jgi:hypothetical protein
MQGLLLYFLAGRVLDSAVPGSARFCCCCCCQILCFLVEEARSYGKRAHSSSRLLLGGLPRPPAPMSRATYVAKTEVLRSRGPRTEGGGCSKRPGLKLVVCCMVWKKA